jgi:hypothetical protein
MRTSARLLLLSLLALVGCGNVTLIYVTIAPSATQALDSSQSVTLTATVLNDASNSGVTWTLSGAGTLTSKTTTSVVYTAPSGVTSAATDSVTATPVKNQLYAAAVEILLQPAPVVTTTVLSSGTTNTAYLAQLNATGGTAPLTWSLTSGTLPQGLSFSTSGVISGTPTAVGTSTFTVQVKDSAATPLSAPGTLTLTILAPTLSITTSGLANGVVNKAYSAQLAQTGGVGPYTWSVVSGALPSGLSLSGGGLLSGAPSNVGAYSLKVQVQDAEATPQKAQKAYFVTVYSALSITTSSLASGSLHNTYSATLQSSGGTGPVVWSLASGSLPAGLTLSTGGVIGGTPTSVATSTFTVQATDSSSPQQVVTQQLSITIVLSTLAITTTSLPQATANSPYSDTLTSSGGNPPVTWALATGSGALPTGLSLSASGVISGTPTGSAGPYPIVVQATDTTPASVTQSFSLTLVALTPLSITTTTLPSGNIGTAYSATVVATGGATPYTWSLSSGTLPQGMTFSGGVLSGTPLNAGSFTFTVQVKDSEATPVTASRQYTISIGTTLAAGTNNAQLTGSYAFLLQGFNVGSTSGVVYGVAAIGSLSANGSGALTGMEYTNSPAGTQSAVAVTGSYTLGSNGQGLMVLTAGGNTNVYTIAAANPLAGVAQSFYLTEFDNATGATGAANATGVAKLQTASAFSAASLNGTFAFGLSGESPCSSCVTPAPLYGPIAAVGVFTANGVSTISAGQEDAAAYGVNYSGVTLTGNFAAPSTTTGIGTLHLTPTGTLFSASPTNYVYVVVASSELLLMSSDTHASNALLAGDVQLQRQASYSASSLSGTAIGYESQANGSSNGGNGATVYPTGLNAVLSNITTTGSGTATLAQDANRAGVVSSTASSPAAITYTTATSGRTAVTTGGASNQVLYLYNTDAGFALDQAATAAYPGLIQYAQQVATAPYPVLLSGPYAAGSVASPAPATTTSGLYTFTLNTGGVDTSFTGTLSTLLDTSSTAGVLALNQAGSFAYTGGSAGGYVVTPSGSSTSQAVVYGINSSSAVAIPTVAGTAPVVTLLQLY